MDKFEYFIEQTNLRLDRIDGKLEQLITFRLVLIGASVGISGLFSFAVTLLTLYLMKQGG